LFLLINHIDLVDTMAGVLLAQLEAFAEIARRGSISRAAEALFVTQPALTARLKSLERELGADLFVRTGRGMRLTDAGRAFLPFAHRSLQAVAEGRSLLAELARGGAGELAVGAAPAVSTYVLPAILERYHASYPNVQLAVRTGHSEEVLELVLREEVEIGLIRALRHPDIESTPLYEDELVLVCDPAHPFAGRGEIAVEEIREERVILFDRTSSYHDLTAAFFREAGVVPRGVMELDNIDATKKMVRQGLGVAMVPHTAAAEELDAGTLRTVRIADAPPVRRRIVAIRRRDAGPPEGLVAAFLGTVEAMRSELERAARRRPTI
jgi:DNA-binding transcriptional LysR family regulator